MADKTGNLGTEPWLWHDNGDGTYTPTVYNTGAGGVGGGGDGALLDGVSSSIKATVKDYTNANPLSVELVDTNGDPVSVGGGTQYTEDAAAPANPVGTALNLVRQDTLAALTTTDGDNVAARGTNKGELYVKQTDAVPVTDNGGSLTVDGTFWQATQPVSGPLTDAQLRATPVAVTGGGGGTEYTEGDTDASITGSAILWEDASDTLRAVSAAKPLPVDLQDSSVAVTDNGGSLTVDGTVTVQDGGGAISVDDNGGSITVDGSVSLAAAIPAGTNNIGDVDVLTLPALPAGTNNIGDVDVLTLPSLPAGNNNIGDVDIATIAAGTQIEAIGDVASDVPIASAPVTIGGRASSALPSAVSADGDAVNLWLQRSGAQMTALLPHLGYIGEPYTLTAKTVQTTTTQTGSDVWTPAGGKKIVVTYFQIQAGGTTAGTVQLWFGANADTTYSRGTDLALFDGEFAPSATLKPGVIQSGVWISPTADFEIHLTTSAAINPLTITIWGYEI